MRQYRLHAGSWTSGVNDFATLRPIGPAQWFGTWVGIWFGTPVGKS